MDNEKNINLVLKQEEQKDEKGILFSFSTIIAKIKRYFLIWVIASIVSAMTVSGIVIMLKYSIPSNNITALVNFNYSGIKSGLAPDGSKFDVNKIKSPNIIETALTELNISLNYVETIRRNIYINGYVPENDRDELEIYQNVYLNGGSAALSAAKTMLDIGYNPTYFAVAFNYKNTKFDITESKQILDEILRQYQEYFFTTYGYNESLGNSVVAVDYTEYDYPTAIDVFDSTLTNLDDYVSKLSAQTPDFRSGKTGYSFRDLSNTIETIQTADVDSISSYVIINSVTNDKEVLINYYNYKIEKLEREYKVYQDELNEISASIENYEKDSMVIIGDYSETLDQTTYSMPSEKYDELVERKITKQVSTSRCKQRIEYYKSRIKALNSSKNNASSEVVKETEERLAEINDKINGLVDIVNQTADEYYETVTFAHAYNILVPASGSESTSISQDLFFPVLITEFIIFIAYIAIVFIKAILHDSNSKLTEKITE